MTVAEIHGKISLKGVQVEFFCFAEDDNLTVTERAPLEPEIIATGERAHFNLKVYYREKLRSYNYRFITAAETPFSEVCEDVHILPP